MEEEKFYTLYPELAPYREEIVLLGEAPNLSPCPSPSERGNVGTLYTRKFVVIQNGCDSFCSFCLTIQARGRHRSLPLEDIIVEIKEREDQGGQEIILTGVNLGAWGAETTTDPRMASLGTLLRAILDKTSIPRIRISSLGPEFINDKLLEVCKDTRILPYFHFSVQSFSDTILQRMRRNYTAQQVKDVIGQFRALDRPDADLINIGADIIAGFPGEGDDEFPHTLQGIRHCGISQLYAFPFYPHHKPQTVGASHLDNKVLYHIAQTRLRLLQAQGQRNRARLIQKTL